MTSYELTPKVEVLNAIGVNFSYLTWEGYPIGLESLYLTPFGNYDIIIIKCI